MGNHQEILKITTAPQLVALATKGPKAAGIDVDKRGKQTIGQLRRGDIKSLDDLKNIWRQTNGTLEERAEQIEQEIRDSSWLEEDSKGVGKAGEVK
ncbi:hypothetical protein [Natrinema sp. SYSU A 869]|uniref:hypothetical protein n=1 Tax=Natrinema sp. SYSU A 869 TaxID=2871694 RepID=UPI001CA43666|nr:hypothetical protein [Natrinema sp. SYSU A 869]